MKYIYEPYNQFAYATNLRKKNGCLNWDISNGGFTLVIQSRFGEDILPEIEKICKKMSEMNAQIQVEPVSLAPEYREMSVSLISAKQKIKGGGYPLRGEVSRYTILACAVEDDMCHVYEPKKKQTLDIPTEITATYAKVYDRKSTGFFRKRVVEEFAGFYEVRIKNDALKVYHDGDLYYVVNEIKIPITEAALKADAFYIKAENMPPIMTNNPGYRIEISEIE